MKTKECINCGRLIDSLLPVCPNCGSSLPEMDGNDITIYEDVPHSGMETAIADSANDNEDTIDKRKGMNRQSRKREILVIAVVSLILIGLFFLLATDLRKKNEREMQQFQNSLTHTIDSLKRANDSLATENNNIRQQQKKEEARLKKESKQKAAAFSAMKKLLSEANKPYDFTDDYGYSCTRYGDKYYVHDMNHDGIPELIIRYKKSYSSFFISDKPYHAVYIYNKSDNKAECIYKRLKMAKPSYQGGTLYLYGDESYDKITFSSAGTYNIYNNNTDDYPSDYTPLEEHPINSSESLAQAFGY